MPDSELRIGDSGDEGPCPKAFLEIGQTPPDITSAILLLTDQPAVEENGQETDSSTVGGVEFVAKGLLTSGNPAEGGS